MVDIAAVVNELPGVQPVAGLESCWTWSAGRFHYTLALAADGAHALQVNCRDEMDTDLVVAVLGFARARTDVVLSAAPFAVMEGFSSPSETPFDSVAATIPAVHRYHPRRRAELNEVTYAVFPAYRCEFSLMETQEEAAYRFDDMLDAANLRRTPSPWVRLRYDNPKTGGGSEGPDLGITSFSVVQRVLRDLEGAEGAYAEFENFRYERRRVSWAGGLVVSWDEDKTRTTELPDLLAWAFKFIYEGVDDAA